MREWDTRPHRLSSTARHSDWQPSPFRLKRRVKENSDTTTLWVHAEKSDLPPFIPGQFNMVYAWGAGEIPISISGCSSKTRDLMHTVRSVGAISNKLVSMKPGDWLGLRGPFGSFWPLDYARGKDVLIIAGGIGFAPLRSVLVQILANRSDYGELMILYGARSPKDFIYKKELNRWLEHDNCRLLQTVDQASPDWKSHVGVVTDLFHHINIIPNRLVALICGPEIMMRFAFKALDHRRVPHTSIFLSMERNMKCATGLCGHCQLGPFFVCRDGPVFRADEIEPFFWIREF
ncbi:MAG: FAD/NAD(P)-binding protein [Oligoflexus sp.]